MKILVALISHMGLGLVGSTDRALLLGVELRLRIDHLSTCLSHDLRLLAHQATCRLLLAEQAA